MDTDTRWRPRQCTGIVRSIAGRAGLPSKADAIPVVMLNLEQDHKRWRDRLPLISAETAGLRPDVIALNEVCVPLQTARLLRDSATAATGIPYKLVQQTRVNGLSKVESEALLTQFAIVETGNLDYQAHDIVALVARVVIEERPVDFYVTHLYRSRGADFYCGFFRCSSFCNGSTAGRTASRRSCAATSTPPSMPLRPG